MGVFLKVLMASGRFTVCPEDIVWEMLVGNEGPCLFTGEIDPVPEIVPEKPFELEIVRVSVIV